MRKGRHGWLALVAMLGTTMVCGAEALAQDDAIAAPEPPAAKSPAPAKPPAAKPRAPKAAPAPPAPDTATGSETDPAADPGSDTDPGSAPAPDSGSAPRAATPEADGDSTQTPDADPDVASSTADTAPQSVQIVVKRAPPPPAKERARTEAPRYLDYEEGDEIPAGYVKDQRIRPGLVITGAVTLGALWLGSTAIAAHAVYQRDQEGRQVTKLDDLPPEAALVIPVAGPFVALETMRPGATGTALLVADGLAQAGGLVMLVAGLIDKRTILVRDDRQLAVIPLVGPDQSGMQMTGSF
jgi:hypothetical protein